ncbi:MAG TPA: YdeI family protein [Chitinophagaceae bacterium]
MNRTNPDVEWFFTKDTKWQKEYELLRAIVLDCGLTEELKWGCPCYTLNKRNVVLIHGFKDYCALLFMKGVLLEDTHHILVQQTEHVQAARQIRFTGADQIRKMQPVLKEYIKRAIEVERAGLKVDLKSTKEFSMPEEFRAVLEDMPEVKTAFEKLTPGRQRGYLLYFSAAKQSKTREARIEKYLDKILQGKGVDD